MSNPADARRRWFGLFYLFVALGLLIWGQTVLRPHLKGWLFIFYWLLCFGFTLLALLTALLDFWIVRHRSREERRELARKTWGESKKPGTDGRNNPDHDGQP